MLLKVYDDFLPDKFFRRIQSCLLSHHRQWQYADATILELSNYPNVKDSPQFTNHVSNNEWDDVNICVDRFLWYIGESCNLTIDKVGRIKINLLMREGDYPLGFTNTPHSDYINDTGTKIERLTTFLYYVNDADGDTVIYNEMEVDKPSKLTEAKRITPKANRGVLFDSNYYHASTPPRITNRRVVINAVFSTED